MNKYFYQYVIGVPRAIVKWTAKVTLEHTMEAQGGVEVWLYFILNLGARGGWVGDKRISRPLYHPLYRRAGLDSCTKEKISCSHRDLNPETSTP